jgi:hypothetical protein
MWVRSTCDHFHGAYRKEGEKFEHDGKLYEHVVPAEPDEDPQQEGESESRQMKTPKAKKA